MNTSSSTIHLHIKAQHNNHGLHLSSSQNQISSELLYFQTYKRRWFHLKQASSDGSYILEYKKVCLINIFLSFSTTFCLINYKFKGKCLKVFFVWTGSHRDIPHQQYELILNRCTYYLWLYCVLMCSPSFIRPMSVWCLFLLEVFIAGIVFLSLRMTATRTWQEAWYI